MGATPLKAPPEVVVAHVGHAIEPVVVTGPPVIGAVVATFVTVPPPPVTAEMVPPEMVIVLLSGLTTPTAPLVALATLIAPPEDTDMGAVPVIAPPEDVVAQVGQSIVPLVVIGPPVIGPKVSTLVTVPLPLPPPVGG